ncbi:hypothetical protein THIX_90279 [Thiomonas sp. X19]|nr:hypothetical protein THIX_90279 [Thiomonas sp. X19]
MSLRRRHSSPAASSRNRIQSFSFLLYFASSFKDSWIVRFHSRAELAHAPPGHPHTPNEMTACKTGQPKRDIVSDLSHHPAHPC